MRRPHPLLIPVVVLVLLAAVAGLAVAGRSPGYALDSTLIYRIEVGGVVLGAGYVLLVVLLLAWHGRTLTRIELPGGAAVEADPAPGLEAAADAFGSYREATDERLDLLEQNFDLLAGGEPPPDLPGGRRLDGDGARGTVEGQ